jgi:hypothetical protein
MIHVVPYQSSLTGKWRSIVERNTEAVVIGRNTLNFSFNGEVHDGRNLFSPWRFLTCLKISSITRKLLLVRRLRLKVSGSASFAV